MDCSTCGEELADLEEIMFFCKEEKDVFMTIKPEDIIVVKKRSFVYQGEGKNTKVANYISIPQLIQYSQVFCKHCQDSGKETNIGKYLPFAPAGQSFPAFGTEKVSKTIFARADYNTRE